LQSTKFELVINIQTARMLDALEGHQAMAEYEASLEAMREKTARLRALRLARDAANRKTPTTTTKRAG
jgi:hypothetical protein